MYDGRKDFQVKHMGYRIELGEIETAALGLNEIREACASYDQQKKEIILFFVGDTGCDVKQIRSALLKKIPKYMVPTVLIQMDRFPYNDNGKIDRKRLMNDYMAKQ